MIETDIAVAGAAFLIGLIFVYCGHYKEPINIFGLNLPEPKTQSQCLFFKTVGILLIISSLYILIVFVFAFKLPGPEVVLLDSMDNCEGWNLREDNATDTIMQSVEGLKGNAIRIDYNLGVDGAVVISKKIPAAIRKDISKINKISFQYIAKGNIKKGNCNSIEVQLDDNDRSLCFGRKLRHAAGAANWTLEEIRVKDILCWGCDCKGNETIDLNKVDVLSFAISNKDGEDGGQGSLIIDQVEGIV